MLTRFAIFLLELCHEGKFPQWHTSQGCFKAINLVYTLHSFNQQKLLLNHLCRGKTIIIEKTFVLDPTSDLKQEYID